MARLAGAGVVFENAYSPSPLCLPARSAFVSGKRVHEIQCYNNSLANLRTDFLDYGRVLTDQGIHCVQASSYLIRRGRWKLLYHCEAPHQLFDLQDDPDETTNRAGQRPDVVTQLIEELSNICSPEEENRRAADFIQAQLEAIG